MSIAAQSAKDWLGKAHTHIIAWWLPKGAIVATLFAPVAMRAAAWTTALIWMGAACILNARRCGRTHCRYTGPYYLAMTLPVLVLVSGKVPANFHGWLALALLIIWGGWIMRWATERAWGNYS